MSKVDDGLAVVVVSYGSTTLLRANLVAVATPLVGARVIVVDNFSTASEREQARSLCDAEAWTLLEPQSNLGFGGGANLGMAAAFADGAREVLLLNPDARIGREDLVALRARVQEDRELLVSPRVVTPEGRNWFAGLDLYLDDGTIRGRSRRADHEGAPRVEWLSGACLLVTREIWELTGGFDDDYFLYWEDVDLSYRVIRAGGRVDVVDEAVAMHDEGATHRSDGQRDEAKSEIYYYYNIRNHLLFAQCHLAAAEVRAWRRASLRNARTVLLRGGRRQFLRPVRPLRAAWRGLRDGHRLARRPRPDGRESTPRQLGSQTLERP